MFLSVKERARQIALGQFTAPTPSAPLIDLAPEPAPVPAPPTKTGAKDTTQKAAAESRKMKLSKSVPAKEPTPKVAPQKATPKAAPPKTAPPKATPAPASKPTFSKAVAPPAEAPAPKKPSSKSKIAKEPPASPTEALPPKKSSSKSKTTREPPSPTKSKTPKEPPSPKVSSYMSPWTSLSKPPPSPKPESHKSKPSSTSKSKSSSTSKSKRAKSPPKRVDSPLASSDNEDDDPLSTLKTSCLKQITAVPGLGSRQLAIVLKQRSSGEWYAALKDTGADKYLKSWMNREKTYKTRREALEAYLGFATKMRDRSGTGMAWFPMSPRSGSPKGKGR